MQVRRNARRGNFVRVKNNFYVLESNWAHYRNSHFYQISNFLQVPSYVSCMTALAFHNITTQVQRDWVRKHNLGAAFPPVGESQDILFVLQSTTSGIILALPKTMDILSPALKKPCWMPWDPHSLGRYPLEWSSLHLDSLDRQRLS